MGSVRKPIVIAHRGVPGSRLEHTRAGYELAIELGADYLEPDVVCSADGHLVVRHENEIGHTTDVADHPEFAERHTTKFVDGIPRTGWFTEDFTLAELRTLRVIERLPQLRPQNIALGGREPVMTLDEVIDIAEAATRAGRPVGLYVEVKHRTYFRELGLDLGDRLVDVLRRRGLAAADSEVPVVVQCFETGLLRELRERVPLPLIQLLDRKGAPWDLVAARDPRDYAALVRPEEVARIAEYADGIGPNKSLVIGRDSLRRLTTPTGLVGTAHAVGLEVHVWTMRDENNFLPADHRVGDDVAALGDAAAEYRRFLDAGVDGFHTDHTGTAVPTIDAWCAARV